MKSREEMVSSILAFGIKMRFILAEANIKQSYVSLPEKKDTIPTTLLEEGLAWITELHDKEFILCLETKALIPEEQWIQYRFLDMEGAPEVIELKQRFRALRKKVINKERPAVFRRKVFRAKQRQRQSSQDVKKGNLQTRG